MTDTQHDLTGEELYSLVRTGPLVSIDLIARAPDARLLVGLRNNQPARGTWFVPGGRIRKDERVVDAIERISLRELGRRIELAGAEFIGVFEHLYPTNFSGRPGTTHYVVLAMGVRLSEMPATPADDQHARWRWLTEAELLADPDVHENTKAYFRPTPHTAIDAGVR
jgi:colanic acid biosynthesis protein WcaH